MRVARILLGVVFLAVMLLPPWRVTWSADAKDPGPVSMEETWAGFRPWTYSRERPTTVIAWDGPSTGGHVPMTGTPHLAFGVWTVLMIVSGAALYSVMFVRRRDLP
jgi:hypothetical protein